MIIRRGPLLGTLVSLCLLGVLLVHWQGLSASPARPSSLLWDLRQLDDRSIDGLLAAQAHSPTTVMLVSYPRMWPTVFYLVGLHEAGFDLTVVGDPSEPPGQMAARSSHVRCFVPCGPHLNISCLANAIVACRPALLVPLSDVATETLLNLNEDLLSTTLSRRMKHYIQALLARSLPALQYRRLILDKTKVLRDLAQRHLGLRVPPRQRITFAQAQELAQLSGFSPSATFPLVLKASRGVAGQGVRVIRKADDLARHVQDLLKRTDGEGARLDGRALDGDLELHVEMFFAGNAAMLNVACLRGRVLAAYGLWKNGTDSATGPSIVNSVVHNEEMVRTAVSLMQELQYTGFAGLEFMIADDAAYLMDFNPRINTGSVHPLSRFGLLPLDLLEAMRLALQNPNDARLGPHIPTDLDPSNHVFLKFDPRKIATVVKLAHSKSGQIPHSHVSRAPWCDAGIREFLAATEHINMSDVDCSITAPGVVPANPLPGKRLSKTTLARAATAILYDPGCDWCRRQPPR